MANEVDEVLQVLRARKDAMRAQMATHRTDVALLRRWEALRRGERAILDVMGCGVELSHQPNPAILREMIAK